MTIDAARSALMAIWSWFERLILPRGSRLSMCDLGGESHGDPFIVRLGQGEVDTVVGTVVEATIAAKAASFSARSGPARQASAAYQ